MPVIEPLAPCRHCAFASSINAFTSSINAFASSINDARAACCVPCRAQLRCLRVAELSDPDVMMR